MFIDDLRENTHEYTHDIQTDRTENTQLNT